MNLLGGTSVTPAAGKLVWKCLSKIFRKQ